MVASSVMALTTP